MTNESSPKWQLEKRLYRLSKMMNGSYSKKQKEEMGKEIVRLTRLLKKAKGMSSEELSENDGVGALIALIIVAALAILAIIVGFVVCGFGRC